MEPGLYPARGCMWQCDTLRPNSAPAAFFADEDGYDLRFAGTDGDNSVRKISESEADFYDGWVGSTAWASAREARRQRVLGSVTKKRQCRKPPPTPLLPPPEMDVLHIELDHCQDDPSQITQKLEEQLRESKEDDMALRKKTFKGLCAKWHPDKNMVSGTASVATEVFQFLQSQKAWYLAEDPETALAERMA